MVQIEREIHKKMSIVKAFIRADASDQMGTGHIGRDLALAEGFKSRGIQPEFICRALKGNLISSLENKGLKVHVLPSGVKKNDSAHLFHSHWLETTQNRDAQETLTILTSSQGKSILVVDHYGLDQKWEAQLKPHCQKLVVIDDLADRSHDCDFLIDQNFHRNQDQRYENLVAKQCNRLLGPAYALLRSEFSKVKRQEKSSIRHILVFMGGIDLAGDTVRVLKALRRIEKPFEKITVVIGASTPHRIEIENLCKQDPLVTCLVGVSNMAELMATNDMMISGGGSTTWERCCLGLPALVISVAENQRETSKFMAENGFQNYLGHTTDITEETITNALDRALQDPKKILEIGRRGMELVDGHGISRILDQIS